MKWSLCFIALSLYLNTFATEPQGYYSSAENTNGAALKTAIGKVVLGHIERTYDQLWSDFQTTDKRADGKVWDMYSNCNFTFGTDQDSGSGGTVECQFYNREHSFPNSWFAKATPMYSDLFHMYPTDKHVNNSRGNNAFGETSSPSKTFINGSKLGPSSVAGYSGTVYEPIDEYKGDFARSYFYMVTAYDDRVANWKSDQLAGNQYPAFASWCIDMFLRWSAQDPVSQKETNRQEAIYGIQHNRNPFIDHPELAEYIWGNNKTKPWTSTTADWHSKQIKLIQTNFVKKEILLTYAINNLSYSIYDLRGCIIANKYVGNSTSIPLYYLHNGLYILRLFDDEGVILTDKIVVSN
ncbi:MAG: endonuclease [Bacteroidales bacterium]